MKAPKKSSHSFSNYGFTTIMLAFIMMCICTFSTLALVTANSDYKLSKAVATKNQKYYAAEQCMYEHLAKIDQLLCAVAISTDNADTFYKESEEELSLLAKDFTEVTFQCIMDKDGNTQYYMTTQISETQTLEVVFIAHYPVHDKDIVFEILEWKSVTYTEIEEDTLDLIG